jgi:hypothetical protein
MPRLANKTPGGNIQSVFAHAGRKSVFSIDRLFSQCFQQTSHDLLVFQDAQIQLDDSNFIFLLKYSFYFGLYTLKEDPCPFSTSLKDSVAAYIDPKPLA